VATPSVLLYVHVPFCTSKCFFCDWVVEIPSKALRQGADSELRRRYLDALIEQIRRTDSTDHQPRILYWGGGTASILTTDEITRIWAALRDHHDLSQLVEATIESSPETLTAEKLACLYEQGFRRISIGVQSFDDERLRTIGRAHDAQTAVRALELAYAAGFRDINIDLICGLPGERAHERERTLELVRRLPVNHFSVYPYRATNGTVLAKQITKRAQRILSLDEQVEAYEHMREGLKAAGHAEYSLNFFGEPRCRSDLAYFNLEMDWYGFGAGATSLVHRRYRSTERAGLATYLEDPLRVTEDVAASSPHVVSRLLYQSLSTPWGLIADNWEQRVGLGLNELLEHSEVRYLIDFFRRVASVVVDDDGARVPFEQVPRAFINLLFLNAPASVKRIDGARALFGAY
jgi:oxygen-independent coproporphyrinogen-3 oxidase